MDAANKLVTVDSRQRVSLGKLADRVHYLATKEPDGRIVLTPALVAPEVLEYPDDLRANIDASLRDPASWPRRGDPDAIGQR